MMGGPTDHDIPLTTRVDGDEVLVEGDGGADLPPGSKAHRFRFILNDGTGLNVRFVSLDAEDNRSSCPPASGDNSRQIVGVTMKNNKAPKTAEFTDNNNNVGGPMDVCYQWNFACDDPTKRVRPFDPIIRNGGI